MKFIAGGYTNSNGKGIGIYSVEDGKINEISTFGKTENPSWVAKSKNGKYIYCVNEARNGGVASVLLNPDDTMSLLSRVPTIGGGPCHLSFNPDETVMYVSNYGTGTLDVYDVKEGVIFPCKQSIWHGEGAHAHQTTYNVYDNLVYVCDLGCDCVFIYKHDTDGLLCEVGKITVPKGYGPRHLVIANENTIYLACELKSRVMHFKKENGTWVLKQDLSTVPNDFDKWTSVAAIRMYDGCVYISNRGHDSIAKFDVDECGNLTLNTFLPCGGNMPRDFIKIGDNFIVANQSSNNVHISGVGDIDFGAPSGVFPY